MIAETANMPKGVLALAASRIAIPGAAMGLVVMLVAGVAIPGAAMGLVVVLAEEDPNMDMHGTALTMAETVTT